MRRALIEPIEGKGVFEHVLRCLKSNAMNGVVFDGLGIVSFKRFITHGAYCLAVV
ncbi:MAG: hypothetical protein P4L43_06965 [Syntrophobacteraceae bacterium]|nr:hypothetical protein [Syntrophobacteraceae bacterium]